MALKIHFNRKGHDLLSWRLMVSQLFGVSPQDRQFAVISNPKKTHLDLRRTEEVATAKHVLMAHRPLSL